MTHRAISQMVICTLATVWLVIFLPSAQAGRDWNTYTHSRGGFSLQYPSSLKPKPGKPKAETVPSQEFEWEFPDAEGGPRAVIFLGFYDMPEGETLQAWLADKPGRVQTVNVGSGRSIPAFLRTALDSWAYEREVYVPDEKRAIIVAITLVIRVAERGAQGGVAGIEAQHAGEIAAFMEMVGSFRR